MACLWCSNIDDSESQLLLIVFEAFHLEFFDQLNKSLGVKIIQAAVFLCSWYDLKMFSCDTYG
jgi:hypothetical protein